METMVIRIRGPTWSWAMEQSAPGTSSYHFVTVHHSWFFLWSSLGFHVLLYSCSFLWSLLCCFFFLHSTSPNFCLHRFWHSKSWNCSFPISRHWTTEKARLDCCPLLKVELCGSQRCRRKTQYPIWVARRDNLHIGTGFWPITNNIIYIHIYICIYYINDISNNRWDFGVFGNAGFTPNCGHFERGRLWKTSVFWLVSAPRSYWLHLNLIGNIIMMVNMSGGWWSVMMVIW